MIQPENPQIAPRFQELLGRIRALGILAWLSPAKIQIPDRDGLIYLCKFGFYTGLLTKSQIAHLLELDRQELKQLVRDWHTSHRQRGCGTC